MPVDKYSCANVLRVLLQAPSTTRVGKIASFPESEPHRRAFKTGDGDAEFIGNHRRRVRQVTSRSTNPVARPNYLSGGRVVSVDSRRHGADDLIFPADAGDDRRRPRI